MLCSGLQYNSSGTSAVQPGVLDGNSSQVYGPGLAGCVAGQACRIYVQLCDSFGSYVVGIRSILGTA